MRGVKIQVVSDLHLDQLKIYSNEKLIYPDGDILVLGGDICHISTIEKHKFFFRYLSENFQYVVYIPGNHEFYNDEETSVEESEKKIRKFLVNFVNFIYLNNESVVIENFLISGSCLWYEPETLPKWFRINVTPKEICEMYQKSMDYLESIKTSYKHIIVTHYPPPKNNLGKLSALAWITGHTHQNFSIFEGDTLYLSNQRKGLNYSNSVVLKIY